MSIWWGRREAGRPEQRAMQMAPIPPLVYPSGGSFADVNLTSAEAPLQSVAVRTAVDLIASLGSELPVDVYQGTGRDQRALPMPSYLEDPGGDGNGLQDWSYQGLTSWLLRGNLYGDILDVARGGFATQVQLHHPDDVAGWLDGDGVVHWAVGGRNVTNVARFLHRRVNPMPGRVQGLSPVGLHAEQLGLSLSATRFGRQWFTDGAHPGGMLVNSEVELKPEQAKTAKDRFMVAIRGTREPVVLGKGWSYKQIQVNPEESQFLETQGYTEAQCARIFGPGVAEVLGYETGGSMTYANVVDRDLHLLKYALNKWLRRLERLLTGMLPPGQYVRLNRDALLETDALTRWRVHEIALRNRARVVNEVRDDEDWAPVEWGDEPNPITGGKSADEPKKDGA